MPDKPAQDQSTELTHTFSVLGLTWDDFEDLDLEDTIGRDRESSVHAREHSSQMRPETLTPEMPSIRRGSTSSVMNPLNVSDAPELAISSSVTPLSTEVIRACILNILARENHFSSHVRWSALSTVLQRLGASLTLSQEGLRIRQTTPHKREGAHVEGAKATDGQAYVLRGNGLPLQTTAAISTTSGTYTFLEHVGQHYLTALKLATLAFVGYQLAREDHRSVLDILNIWSSQTNTAARNFIHFAVGEEWEWFIAVLPLPAVIALIQSAVAAWGNTRHDERIHELIARIKVPTASYWMEVLNAYNPLASLFDRTTIALIHAHKTLTWKGSVSLEKQKSLFQAVVQLAQTQTPRSAEAMTVLAQLLQSDHVSDLAQLNGTENERKAFLRQRLLMKAQALMVLKESAFAPVSPTASRFAQLGQLYSSLTLRSLLWEAGFNPEGWGNGYALSTYFAFWKGVSVYLLGQLAYIFFQEIEQYLQCPEMPYSFVTGQYDTRFDEACFNEAVRLYNIVPGEPPENLFGNMNQYRLGSTYELDLSGKGLDGGTIATILKLFRDQHITITALNLSGNAVGFSDGIDPSDTIELGKALAQLRRLQTLDFSANHIGYNDATDSRGTVSIGSGLSHLTALTTLDLSQNGIGNGDAQDSSGTVAIGEGLSHFEALTALDLSGNFIGGGDGYNSSGTVAIGEGLGHLTALTTLDFSANGIGFGDSTDSNGTEAIGEGLSHLRALTTLDLSGNTIGLNDGSHSSGTVAIGGGLSHLTALTALDLAGNFIGGGDGYNSRGTVAIGQGLSHLTALTTLDLSTNHIGSGEGDDSSGTVAIGSGLSHLTTLTTLDFSYNGIGSNDDSDPSGTVAIGNGLSRLMALRMLDLSDNYIGGNDDSDPSGTVAIGKSISDLSSLQNLDISENYISLEEGADAFYLSLRSLDIPKSTSNVVIFPQQRYGVGLSILNQMYPIHQRLFLNATDVSDYFSSIDPLTTEINLSGRISNLSVMGEVMSVLARFPLQLLNLSSNSIGSNDRVDPSNTVALGKGLSQLASLTTLDLSGNKIGIGGDDNPSGTVAIGEGLSHLTALTTLDLSGNWIGGYYFDPSGMVAIGEGLSHLTALTTLDLSYNWIGGNYFDPSGMVAIGEGLSHLTALTTLDLSHNRIIIGDSSGTVAIGEGLSHLTALTTLDLSDNSIGQNDGSDPSGTVAIGEGLSHLTALRTLDLSGNYIGEYDYTNSRGTVAIGNGLSHLRALTTLDLSHNDIGQHDDSDPSGTVAIGEALGFLVHLENLNCEGNYIGSGGPQGPAAFLGSIPKLNHLQNLNLDGMTNISWTQAAKDLASFRGRLLADECEAELCDGTSITHSGYFSASGSIASVREPESTTLLDTFFQDIKTVWDYWAGALVDHIACAVVECPTYFPRESLRGGASHWGNNSGFFNGSHGAPTPSALPAPTIPLGIGMP